MPWTSVSTVSSSSVNAELNGTGHPAGTVDAWGSISDRCLRGRV